MSTRLDRLFSQILVITTAHSLTLEDTSKESFGIRRSLLSSEVSIISYMSDSSSVLTSLNFNFLPYMRQSITYSSILKSYSGV